MSKPVKNLIIASYKKRFGQLDGAVLVDIRSVKSNQANQLRSVLAGKKIKVSVVTNNLARRAFADTKLAKIEEMFQGPSALVYGGESVVDVARALIEVAKDIETLQFKGALMDGQIFSAAEIDALSKYPTKAEAQAQAITLILSPARKIAGQIAGPGRKVASLVKAIQEKKEKEGAPAAV